MTPSLFCCHKIEISIGFYITLHNKYQIKRVKDNDRLMKFHKLVACL